MARWMQPSDEQLAGFMDWYNERPKIIKDLVDKLDMWTLYRLRDTGHRCTIYSYNEDGTVTVAITGQFNLINFGRRVFGISPDDLTECDLPAPGEPLGVTMSEKEQMDYLNEQRAVHGFGPITPEQLQALKDSEYPACAIETTPEVSDGKDEGKGQEEGRQEESGEGKGEAGQASTEAVPAQEAGPTDDQTTDKT